MPHLSDKSKCLTSQISQNASPFLKILLAIKGYMHIVKKTGSLIGYFWAALLESSKKGLKRPQFPNCSISINNYLKVTFFISKQRFKSFLPDEFYDFAKKMWVLFGCTGCAIFLVILQLIFKLIISNDRFSDFRNFEQKIGTIDPD